MQRLESKMSTLHPLQKPFLAAPPSTMPLTSYVAECQVTQSSTRKGDEAHIREPARVALYAGTTLIIVQVVAQGWTPSIGFKPHLGNKAMHQMAVINPNRMHLAAHHRSQHSQQDHHCKACRSAPGMTTQSERHHPDFSD